MYEQDMRRIRMIGLLAVLTGLMMLMFTLAVGVLELIGNRLLGGTDWHNSLRFLIMLVTSFALLALGGDIQHASSASATNRQNLRLDWTALLVSMVVAFGFGLWLFQPLAFVASLIGLGLLAVRDSVINVTNLS